MGKTVACFFSDLIDNDLHSKHAVEIEQIIAMSCASVAGILANSPFKFKKCTGVSGIEHPSKDPIDRTLETLNQDLKKFLKSYRRKIQGAFEHTHPEGKDVPSQDLGHMKALDIATSWLEVQFDKHLNSTNLNQDLTQGLRSPLQKRPKPFQTRKNQPKPSPF